ncbi:MAG: hypothetical protein ACLQVY_26320 [Limisphaerales bacterium]
MKAEVFWLCAIGATGNTKTYGQHGFHRVLFFWMLSPLHVAFGATSFA